MKRTTALYSQDIYQFKFFFVSAKNCQNQSLILQIKNKPDPKVKEFLCILFYFYGCHLKQEL